MCRRRRALNGIVARWSGAGVVHLSHVSTEASLAYFTLFWKHAGGRGGRNKGVGSGEVNA
ncbi:hypothetical protein E2C01_000140 [Portunus trituberculatus]|uniref:Uncharacterized protein n=1 Tax=Portunus trituberculatus TaxID=210409 RepID=A0A5B7CE45_PORTR|nr:hypothetical protein [Portunus trituberculatus]